MAALGRAHPGKAVERDLCRQKDIGLVEGKAMPDHIRVPASVPLGTASP
jgi:hypothetical protein